MKLRWKGGQLKLPIGPDQKIVSKDKTYIFQISRIKLNYPIDQSILELVYILITRF